MMNFKKSLLFVSVAAASTCVNAGMLSINDPSAINPGQTAQFSQLHWGPTLFSNDVGTAVNPDYSGGSGSFVHSAGTNGALQNTNVTCANDGSSDGIAIADNLGEVNAAGIPRGDYWQQNVPFGVYETNQFSACDINFGASGEVVDGWGQNPSFGSGATLVQPFFNFTAPRYQSDFVGVDCASQTGSALAAHGAAALELIKQGGSFGAGSALSNAVLASDPGLAIGSCSLAFMGEIAMGQCDPQMDSIACVGDIGKAVPIPGIAAAILGAGLVGVTLLVYVVKDSWTHGGLI